MENKGSRIWLDLLDKVSQGLMVRTNSKMVQPGEVFVAIPGVKVDGAAYIPDALQRGAGVVIAAQPLPVGALSPEDAGKLVIHPDPRVALGDLARAYFDTDRHSLKLVGVTGTNGKTSVSYMVEHLLASAGLKVGVLGTVSYRWPGFSLDAQLTTPDCWQIHELLANMERSDVDVVVMEVSSHALDQRRVAGLSFQAGVLTNVTQDHLDYHTDMESYFNAKSKLFFEYPSQDKAWIVNMDDPWGRRLLAANAKVLGFGLKEPANTVYQCLTGSILSASGKGMEMEVNFEKKSWRLTTPLIGSYNASNLLAAQAVGLKLGMNCRDMRRLASFTGAPGRLQRVENDQDLDIFVDFAHTPDALENVLGALRELHFNRLLVLFGCGGNRDATKRPLMGRAVARYADAAIVTSDNPRFEHPTAIIDDILPGLEGFPDVVVEVDRRMAIHMAIQRLRPGDCLLVAGKGHENYQEINGVKRHFSDVEEVRNALQGKAA
ncbi:MAG: UDP-N-acetylmuramoyl-L-alanyl-D-glutamate--2,6-diaminopimelate ligase [Desulfovibrionales bacterium]|jgi:UDP-N-acetylmuramoyl-L-alanyl-D-glutamate--2,6-diaminopimelate ligase|nr:UDP-N-acetylmuramoyl-L-alanyl-D-glutamate--2,6-diaminopimelate ligase [Desulfovibrionales bacterium]